MESTFQTVIEYFGIITSVSTLIFNILLIRPCLKVTNVYPNFVLLNLNFIISSMICALYFLFTSIHKLFDLISCEVIVFIRCFWRNGCEETESNGNTFIDRVVF